MSTFRVTERSIADRVLTGLQGNLGKLGKFQEQLSSGKQLTRPSDNPGNAMSAMQYRTDTRTFDQYSRNADDGIGWLGTIDTALTGTVERVRTVRNLVLQGMSAGTGGSPEAREALAMEIDNIREGLIGLANTKYLDRPVFGGNAPGGLAYDTSGQYVGDTGVVTRTVGDNTKVAVNAVGPDTFGDGENQLFDVLSSISNKLRTDPAGLSADLTRLDASSTTILTRLSDVGARYGRVEYMREQANDRAIDLKGQLSEVEDIDLPATITDMQLQQASYQAALAAAAKVVQPSLVDFLR